MFSEPYNRNPYNSGKMFQKTNSQAEKYPTYAFTLLQFAQDRMWENKSFFCFARWINTRSLKISPR